MGHLPNSLLQSRRPKDDCRMRARSGPAAEVQVHREETEVKEGSTVMEDLRDVKAGTRRFEGPDVYESREES